MSRWILALSAVLLSLPALAAGPHSDPAAKAPDSAFVVFVCEHGSAKSLVAAAHFNEIARQRGLPWRAVSRGTVPDEEMAVAATKGLKADGLPVPEGKPAALTQADLDTAREVVLFAVDLPSSLQPRLPPATWQVPPVSGDYAAARAAIVARIEQLLTDLERGEPSARKSAGA